MKKHTLSIIYNIYSLLIPIVFIFGTIFIVSIVSGLALGFGIYITFFIFNKFGSIGVLISMALSLIFLISGTLFLQEHLRK